MLLERDAEVATIAVRVNAVAAGGGGVVWIEGPAGIGKTRLLDQARERAEGAGVRVLAARASELEREFAFGVVRSLFEPVLTAVSPAERDVLLSGAARLASPIITLEGLDTGAETASMASLHGLYWLIANLAEQQPLLLVVDDAHWADSPSLQALAYLARRIADLPVGLVIASRPSDSTVDPSLIDALRDEPATVVLHPQPLGRPSSDAMVRKTLGEDAEDAFCAACYEASGGNPLLLDALVRAIASSGVTPDGAGVEAVHERAPAIVATFVLPRLRHLPPEAGAVARAVAVLGRDAQLRHVATLAGLDPVVAAEAAEALSTAQLLAPGRPLAFAHPLIEEAIAERMPAPERHCGHRRAAGLLAEESAAPELVAAHLLPTEALGDPWVVERLRVAARRALAKGVPQAAVSYLRRALDEPPEARTRPQVLFELGSALIRISYSEGLAVLEEAFAVTSDPSARARVALEMACSLRVTLDHRRALSVLEDAIAALGEADPELCLELEAEAVGLARRDPARRAQAAERSRELVAAAPRTSHAAVTLLADTALDALQVPGDTARAIELAEEALDRTVAREVPDAGVVLPATMVLLAADRFEPVLAACDAVIASARQRGSIHDFASASVLRAQARYLQGMLVEAEADARLSDELTAEHAVLVARRYTQAWLVLTLVERGRYDEADTSLRDSGVAPTLAFLLDARGRLRLAQGRAQEALDDFAACGRRLDRRGMPHPGLVPWQTHAALAAHRLGRVEEARRLVAEAVATARRYDCARALGIALRVSGLIEASMSTLREATAVLEGTPARLELARAVVDLGAALRRANQRVAGREALQRGMDLAHRCGADALVERAHEELTATGARPRTLVRTGADALTPSERRVAQLASDGLSNRDIAQALFVTTKTVETHLGNAYRKLMITNRAGITAALAAVT
ncbi:MAG: AAA family ATPase [Actinomycetota bacterium]|nr:AAA family ATPase [Actinomycetota bacterium]